MNNKFYFLSLENLKNSKKIFNLFAVFWTSIFRYANFRDLKNSKSLTKNMVFLICVFFSFFCEKHKGHSTPHYCYLTLTTQTQIKLNKSIQQNIFYYYFASKSNLYNIFLLTSIYVYIKLPCTYKKNLIKELHYLLDKRKRRRTGKETGFKQETLKIIHKKFNFKKFTRYENIKVCLFIRVAEFWGFH